MAASQNLQPCNNNVREFARGHSRAATTTTRSSTSRHAPAFCSDLRRGRLLARLAEVVRLRLALLAEVAGAAVAPQAVHLPVDQGLLVQQHAGVVCSVTRREARDTG